MGRFKHHISTLIAARIEPANDHRRSQSDPHGSAGSHAPSGSDQLRLQQANSRESEVGDGGDASRFDASTELNRAVEASAVALENISAADTAASDVDLIKELAALTRADLLVASATEAWPSHPNGRELLESI